MNNDTETKQYRHERQRGVVFVAFALLLIPFFSFLAFAIDITNISRIKLAEQQAADAATIGGMNFHYEQSDTVRNDSSAIAAHMRNVARLKLNSSGLGISADKIANDKNVNASYDSRTNTFTMSISLPSPSIVKQAVPFLPTSETISTSTTGTPAPAYVVMLLDASGSMNGDKFNATQTALTSFLGKFNPTTDNILVIGFNTAAEIIGQWGPICKTGNYKTNCDISKAQIVANYSNMIARSGSGNNQTAISNTNFSDAFRKGFLRLYDAGVIKNIDRTAGATNLAHKTAESTDVSWLLFTDGNPTAATVFFDPSVAKNVNEITKGQTNPAGSSYIDQNSINDGWLITKVTYPDGKYGVSSMFRRNSVSAGSALSVSPNPPSPHLNSYMYGNKSNGKNTCTACSDGTRYQSIEQWAFGDVFQTLKEYTTNHNIGSNPINPYITPTQLGQGNGVNASTLPYLRFCVPSCDWETLNSGKYPGRVRIYKPDDTSVAPYNASAARGGYLNMGLKIPYINAVLWADFIRGLADADVQQREIDARLFSCSNRTGVCNCDNTECQAIKKEMDDVCNNAGSSSSSSSSAASCSTLTGQYNECTSRCRDIDSWINNMRANRPVALRSSRIYTIAVGTRAPLGWEITNTFAANTFPQTFNNVITTDNCNLQHPLSTNACGTNPNLPNPSYQCKEGDYYWPYQDVFEDTRRKDFFFARLTGDFDGIGGSLFIDMGAPSNGTCKSGAYVTYCNGKIERCIQIADTRFPDSGILSALGLGGIDVGGTNSIGKFIPIDLNNASTHISDAFALIARRILLNQTSSGSLTAK